MQTNTLFITLIEIDLKTEKLRLSKNEEHGLIASFSVLNSKLIRVAKRVLVFSYDIVVIAQRMYDIFYPKYLYSTRVLILAH